MSLERLDALIRQALDGNLTDEVARELNELLRDDSESQRYYVRQCQAHAMLEQERGLLGQIAEAGNVVSLPLGAMEVPVVEAESDGGGRLGAGRGRTARASRDSDGSTESRTRWVARLRASTRPVIFGSACVAAGVVMALFVERSAVSRPVAAKPGAEKQGETIAVASLPKALVRSARLSDGSRMDIALNSTVSQRYTATVRALELQDGQAYFAVKSEDERPFVVTAGAVRVRAVGTAFNVRRAGERVVVTVTEGEVEVYRSGDPASSGLADETASGAVASVDAVTVAAGSQVRWDDQAAGPELAAVDPRQTLLWREGRLEYVNEPLHAVVADLNRYSERPVVILSASVGQMLVTGRIFADATDEWLATLADSLPVRVELEHGGYSIVAADYNEVLQDRS